MKRILVIVLVVIMALSFMACGQNKETITAEEFVSALEDAGFPILDVEIYDENTDPNAVLGRPGEYIGKFNFTHEPKPETYQLLTIEIFEKEADAKKRSAYVEETIEDLGFMGEYIYLDSVYLLRIPYDLTAEEAELYNKAFKQIISDEPVDDVSSEFTRIQQEIDANKSLKDYEFEFDESQNKDDIIEILGNDYEEYAYFDSLYLAWFDEIENGVLEVAFYEDNSFMYAFWYEEDQWGQEEATHIEMMEAYNDISEDEQQEDTDTDEKTEDDPQEDADSDEKTLDKFVSGFNYRIENTISNYADYDEEDITDSDELLINMPKMDEDTLQVITSEEGRTLYGYVYSNINIFVVADVNGIITSLSVKDDNFDEEDALTLITLTNLRGIMIDYITYSMFDAHLDTDNYKKLNGGGSISANGYTITKPKNDIAFLNKIDDDEYNDLYDLLIMVD